MTDSFEKWINSFSEEEYDEMLDDANPFGFSDAQKEKALNIRDMPTKEELEDLELEQEFIEEPIEKPRGKITTVTEIEPTIQEPTIDISGSTAQPIPTPIPIARPTVTPPTPKPRAITQAIKQGVKSGIAFARRLFRV